MTDFSLAGLGIVLLPALWAGAVIGVSFIATPAKFAAPSLTRPVALDVGRYTFKYFTRVEWGLAAALLAALIPAGAGGWLLWAAVALAVLVVVQSLWLLLALTRRITAVIAGETPPPAPYHRLYVGGEVIKLLTLLTLAVAGAGI